MNRGLRVGVVGAGWAGLAAAVELADAGHQVLLWDMSAHAGGRGRSGVRLEVQPPCAPSNPATQVTAAAADVPQPDAATELEVDCGQHILIGAYSASLDLMRRLGVRMEQAMWRSPLQLVDARGRGLRLPGGHPLLAFVRGLAAHSGWSIRECWTLLLTLARWHRQGFACRPGMTVQDLCGGLPTRVVDELIEPLCVAALNIPGRSADASVFLRVLADGLFAGPGGSDLLIPRATLASLLPGPALARLAQGGAQVRLTDRVQRIEPLGPAGWRVQTTQAWEVDRLIIAATAGESARLIEPWDPAWAETARSLRFEPIVTTWVQAPTIRLPCPMVRLGPADGHEGPAQFAFDLGALGHPWRGGYSFVSSDAGAWLSKGLPALEAAVLAQARSLPGASEAPARVVRSVAERRATFRCEPGIRRPPPVVAAAGPGLAVAGDYVQGPYPSTLEGAVRAGVAAAHHVTNS